MAWNAPNSGNDNKEEDKDKKQDPWQGKRGNEPQPPDLDKLLRDLYQRFAKSAKGRRPSWGGANNNGVSSNGGVTLPGGIKLGVGLIAGILFVIYILSGIYIVKPAERAVVFQFGQYVKEVGPGPHWLPPLIRSETTMNVDQIMTSRHSSRMLTEDENIVIVDLAVQYKINNLPDYLFNVVDPRHSLQEATDSAIRQVVGQSKLDDILTAKRAEIRNEIRKQIESTLSLYKAGVKITDVAMQPARAPDEVKDAFDDAIKAQEDEQRVINQANAYREQVVPIAQGQAERILAQARGYAQETKLRGSAEAQRFALLLPEYQTSKNVTRERIYLDTMESILSRMKKVMVDNKSQNMLYLPIDQIFKQQQSNLLNPSNNNANTLSNSSTLSSYKNMTAGSAASAEVEVRPERPTSSRAVDAR